VRVAVGAGGATPDGDAQARTRPRPYVALAFESTRLSLAAEAALVEAGFAVKAIALPPHRGRLCGIALRLPPEQEAAAVRCLEEHDLAVAARDAIWDL